MGDLFLETMVDVLPMHLGGTFEAVKRLWFHKSET